MKTIIIALFALLLSQAQAGEVQVAVAANFTAPMKRIALEFEKTSGHQAQLSFGSTGKFYAQVANGAPFEVLLSADDETPVRMEREGLAVSGTRSTYAIGRLALWSARPDLVDERGEVLRKGQFKYLSIAAPKVAPYGAAAIETLKKLNLLPAVEPKLVQGENIAQAYQFVASGNAELGFVALSQVLENGKLKSGSVWMVPGTFHNPIRQDMALLEKGKTNPAAQALLKFMQSEIARAIILSYGYSL